MFDYTVPHSRDSSPSYEFVSGTGPSCPGSGDTRPPAGCRWRASASGWIPAQRPGSPCSVLHKAYQLRPR